MTLHTRIARGSAALFALLLPALLLISPSAGLAQKGTPTKAFVVNILDSTVSDIDLSTMTELRRIKVGARPYYPCVTADNSVVAVTVEGEEKVKFYDVATLKPRGEISVGKMYAEHLMLLPDGRQAVLANRARNALIFIDLIEGKELAVIEVNAPHNIRVGPSGRYVYVQSKIDPAISIVDIKERKVVKRHPLKLVPRGLAVSPDEKTIWFGANWINALFGMDAATGKILHAISIPVPSTAPLLQENTYHGLEFVGEHTLLAANEGNSTLDAIDIRTGTWTMRTTDVARPAGLLALPGTLNEFIIANKADNSVAHGRIDGGSMVMMKRGVFGNGEDLFAKRFAFHN